MSPPCRNGVQAKLRAGSSLRSCHLCDHYKNIAEIESDAMETSLSLNKRGRWTLIDYLNTPPSTSAKDLHPHYVPSFVHYPSYPAPTNPKSAKCYHRKRTRTAFRRQPNRPAFLSQLKSPASVQMDAKKFPELVHPHDQVNFSCFLVVPSSTTRQKALNAQRRAREGQNSPKGSFIENEQLCTQTCPKCSKDYLSQCTCLCADCGQERGSDGHSFNCCSRQLAIVGGVSELSLGGCLKYTSLMMKYGAGCARCFCSEQFGLPGWAPMANCFGSGLVTQTHFSLHVTVPNRESKGQAYSCSTGRNLKASRFRSSPPHDQRYDVTFGYQSCDIKQIKNAPFDSLYDIMGRFRRGSPPRPKTFIRTHSKASRGNQRRRAIRDN